MSYSVTALPVIFCSAYPDCSKILVPMPYGLPDFSFDNPCCEGLNITLDQLEGLLRPLTPFLKLVECALKLVSIVMAVPDAIGPPPDIGKLVELVEAAADFVTKCLPLILNLSPASPFALVAFCKMVRGVAQLVLSILRCLRKVIVLNISITGDAIALSTSVDPLLRDMGICLAGQNTVLSNGIIGKLNSLLNVFTLINTLLEVLFTFAPALKTALTDTEPPIYPIRSSYTIAEGLPPSIVESIDSLIVVFTVVEGAAGVCSLDVEA